MNEFLKIYFFKIQFFDVSKKMMIFINSDMNMNHWLHST